MSMIMKMISICLHENDKHLFLFFQFCTRKPIGPVYFICVWCINIHCIFQKGEQKQTQKHMTHSTFIETELRLVSAIRMSKLMNKTATTTTTETSSIVLVAFVLFLFYFLKKKYRLSKRNDSAFTTWPLLCFNKFN